MDEISEVAWAARLKEIERARNMSLPEKFLAGAILFEQACDVTRCEIRSQNPGWTDHQVEAELELRFEPERLDKEAALILCSGR